MNTMYRNNHTRFREISDLCKRIFPEIIDIHPRKHVDNTISILIRKKNQSSEIDLTYEASGIDQLFRIIWIMATSKKDVIWFLDEPELHLHPGAQKLLYDFLKDEVTSGKQVFVATQSMVFIHKSELNEVSIILNRDNLYISSLEELVSAEEEITSETQNTIRDQIYMALGYEPRFSFEPEKIVVEGKSDGHILSIFSQKLGLKLDPRTISFVPLGDRHHVEKYSPILAYTLSNKKCLIILDNDRKDPQTTMNSILQKEKEFKRRIGDRSTLSESNFYLYPSDVYSLEHYLLHPESIYKAASNILNKAEKSVDNSLLENIRDKIEESTSNKIKIDKPKEIIKNVWETSGLGNYDEVETGVEIAKCLPEQYLKDNSQIVKLVESIKL
jgi:predicted ATP-dependent endonuclease of OLD family